MKLFASAVILISLLASKGACAQAGGLTASDALPRASQRSQTITVTRSGERISVKAPAEHFTGFATIDRFLVENASTHTSGASVAFEPGARTNWHSHPLGQTLIVTAGLGWVQQWGGPVQVIRQGDIVWIPPGLKHWHGATVSTPMTHIAIQESLNGKAVEWMEKVSDQQYGISNSTSGDGSGTAKETSATPKLTANFTPSWLT